MSKTKSKRFVPPEGAASAARRGLELRAKFGRGGTAVGVARARGLSKRRALPLAQVAKIYSYHERHAVDAQGEGWASESDPSAGWIAYLLWGGAAAKKWASAIRAKHGTPSRPKRLQKGRAHVQDLTRKGLEARAARHRAEVAPILAPIEAELAGDLLDRIDRKILDDDAAALAPTLVGRGRVTPQEFADAFAIARANPGMSLFSALARRGVAVLSLAGAAPPGLIASTTEAGRNLRRVRALVDHFHRAWNVPDKSQNAARIRAMQSDPSWGADAQGGTLPGFQADDFAAMTHPEVMPLLDVVHVKKIDPHNRAAVLRAFALEHAAVMDHTDDHAAFWHEAAHTVEMASQDIGRRVKDFLLHRLERDQDFNMKQTTPGKPDELGYKDGFQDAYTGRWYYRDGVDEERTSHASEVLSQGMTYLARDARAFAKRDPEHMALILAALGGKLGLRDATSDAEAPVKVERRRKMGTFSLDALRAWHKKG